MSSYGSIPGIGHWVAKGCSPTGEWEWVRATCSADFPELGGPSSAT